MARFQFARNDKVIESIGDSGYGEAMSSALKSALTVAVLIALLTGVKELISPTASWIVWGMLVGGVVGFLLGQKASLPHPDNQ